MSQWIWPPVTTTQGPVQFILDGSVVPVTEDTVTPGNSTPLPVTLLGPSGDILDTDYGVVGNKTLRTAAEIGNATGAADFNVGVAGTQTLRTALATDQLATLNQEATQLLVKADLDTIAAVDFATETTLAAAKADLDTLAAVDFATETTLSAVNVKLNSLGQKNMAGSVPTVIASDQTDLPVVLKASAAIIGTVAIDQTTPGTTNGVQVNAALPAGSNVIGALTANQSVNVAQINGVAPLMGAGNTGTGSQRVTIATDQLAIATKSPVNVTGTYAEITNLTTTAQTFTAPAGAIGFILEALSDNTNNIRWKSGAVATISSGMRLEPGRDSSFVPLDANISVIAEAGSNQVVSVQWVGV